MARRTFWSVFAAVLLCLVMLPATALAAEYAPEELIVANVTVDVTQDGYWTTDPATGELTETQDAAAFNVRFDAGEGALYLKDATIGKGTVSATGGTHSIYAFGKSGVSLTIHLAGESHLTSGVPIHISSDAGNTELNIKGNGTLNAEGTAWGNGGILLMSGAKATTGGGSYLNITDGADVVSNCPKSTAVMFYTRPGGKAVLMVMGASLIANGWYPTGDPRGIFFSKSDGTGTANFYLRLADNAVVRTNKVAILSGHTLNYQYNPASGGIYFNGTAGNVYGNVTLRENLTVGEGEVIKLHDGASLNAGGHYVILDGGTLDESLKTSLGNSVKYTPTITTASLSDGTEGTPYNQALAAAGSDTISWSVTSGSLPSGLSLSGDAISGTPATAGTSIFTVTATNDYGSDSKQLSITIDEQTNVPVSDVTLDRTVIELFVGDSESLIATVEPNNATNKNVTWTSSDGAVATVDASGNVTAVAPGTTTINATSADGGKTATCTVTVIAKTSEFSVSPTTLNFGSVYVGYALPAAQTVTVSNTGNQTVTLTQPKATNYEIGTLSATELEPGDTATFTVQPKLGLGVGTYSETLAVTGSDGASETVSVSFSVSSRPYIPPTPSGPDWDDATDDIAAAEPGECVVVDMDGETDLPGDVLEELAGRDVTLVLQMEDGVAWEIHGEDVPGGTSFSDVNLGVELGSDDIPVNVVNLVTGEAGSIQVTLAHEGPFGFGLTLVAPVGEKNAGLVANLYRYDETTETLQYEAAGVVDEDGLARVRIDHASSWLIALDSHSHTLPFSDAAEGHWYSESVRWAWLNGVMNGYGDGSKVFGTTELLTRAEMATVLWRLAGEPESSTALPADCDGAGFYADAVSWALGVGVFNGYGADSFGPADALTREQAATVLWRLAGDPVADADLSDFSDSGDVSRYAEDALCWAVSEGILRGTGEGLLEPGRAVTRAEMATVLARLAAKS